MRYVLLLLLRIATSIRCPYDAFCYGCSAQGLSDADWGPPLCRIGGCRLFPKKVAAANEGDCCAAATAAGITKWEYTDGECSLYKIASFPKPCGKNSTLGSDPPLRNPKINK